MAKQHDTSPETLLRYIKILENQLFTVRGEVIHILEKLNRDAEHHRFLTAITRLEQVKRTINL